MPNPEGVPPELDAYMGNSGTKKHGSMSEFVDMLEEGMNEASQRHFRELPQCPALVLNADFQPLSYVPLSLWSWQDAIKVSPLPSFVPVPCVIAPDSHGPCTPCRRCSWTG